MLYFESSFELLDSLKNVFITSDYDLNLNYVITKNYPKLQEMLIDHVQLVLINIYQK